MLRVIKVLELDNRKRQQKQDECSKTEDNKGKQITTNKVEQEKRARKQHKQNCIIEHDAPPTKQLWPNYEGNTVGAKDEEKSGIVMNHRNE